MRPRENATRSLLGLLVLSVLLTGLIAGCGGGESGNSEAQPQGDKAARGEEPQKKIALGTIQTFEEDKRKISLELSVEIRGKKQLSFKVSKRAEITLGGEKAEIDDITEGQQAQVEYVDGDKGPRRAVGVDLFKAQRQEPSEGDENTN